jgi:hypothetical protein
MSETIPNYTKQTPPVDDLLFETGTLPVDIETQNETTGEGLTGEGLTGEGLTGEGLTGEGLTGEGLTGEGTEQMTQNATTGEGLTSEGMEQMTQNATTGEGLTGEGMEQMTQNATTGEAITLTTNKSTLTNLAQNLNANLLVTVAAYKAILLKLKDNTYDSEKQKLLEANIKELEMVENSVTNLLTSVQTNLEVEANKMINASGVLEEAGTSNKFTQRLLNTEAIAILAAMLAPIGLGGGGKRKGKKKTRRQRNKGKKTTRKNVSKI